MTSISITINFEYQEPIRLSSGCWSSRLKHWNLMSNCLCGIADVKWVCLFADHTMQAEDFLKLVGANVKEAVAIIMKKNSCLTLEDVKEFITPEVVSFYKQLEINTLESVDFHMVDQS